MGNPMLEMRFHTIVAFPVRLNPAFALAAAHQEPRSDGQRFYDADFLPHIPAPYIAFGRQYHLPRHPICRYHHAYTLYHSYPCRSSVPKPSVAVQLRGRAWQQLDTSPSPVSPKLVYGRSVTAATASHRDGGDVRDGGWTGSAAAL